MGGLLSSNEPKYEGRQPSCNYFHDTPVYRPPTRASSVSRESRGLFVPQPRPTTNSTPNHVYSRQVDDVTRTLESLYIGGKRPQPTRRVTPPQPSRRNPQFIKLFDTFDINSSICILRELQSYESEYLQITRMITNKKNFKVDKIERIENPYLKAAYELKKAQKELEYGYVEERLLFHGTKKVNVDAICTMNFDWRRCQAHKYGKGVSFSPNSTYASVYSDENVYNKFMIVAKVLIGRSCIGNKDMDVPPDGYDTTQKGVEGIVIVKFEDNEYYPAYKISYHVMDESVGKRPNNRRRNSRPRRGRMPVLYVGDYDFDY